MSDISKNVDLKSAIVDIVKICSSTGAKADVIIGEYFSTVNCPFRNAVEAIVLQWLRNKILIDRAFLSVCAKKPKNAVFSVLRAAAADIMSGDSEKFAQIVHSWVEFSKKKLSKNESGFVNAVLRKFPLAVADLTSGGNSSQALSVKFSHPQWLVEKWQKNFGGEETVKILESNQIPSEVFFRKSYDKKADEIFEGFKQYFAETEFENFHKLKSGAWHDVKELLKTPYFYIQDPSTSFAVKQFAPKNGSFLDLCAAPGGKSRFIADLVLRDSPADKLENSLLVSVDMEDRIEPLAENMAKIGFMKMEVLACDILKDNLAEILADKNLPDVFDGVFIDAPCSNSGVLRRRPDARYRIEKSDISNCAEKQLEILGVAKNFVKSGGKLEYSTCSIEPEENGNVISKFLEQNKNFKLVESGILLPAKNNDGAGFALFEKLS